MVWKNASAILLLVSSLLLIVSCNSKEYNTTPADSKQTELGGVKDADLKMAFSQAMAGQLDSMDILCAHSKSYQADQWDELNHCRWALEKQVLMEIPEYAKRNKEILSLQIDDGQWMVLEHSIEEKNNGQYFQLRKYLAKPHYFIVSQLFTSACSIQWFIDAKSGQKLFFSRNRLATS